MLFNSIFRIAIPQAFKQIAVHRINPYRQICKKFVYKTCSLPLPPAKKEEESKYKKLEKTGLQKMLLKWRKRRLLRGKAGGLPAKKGPPARPKYYDVYKPRDPKKIKKFARLLKHKERNKKKD